MSYSASNRAAVVFSYKGEHGRRVCHTLRRDSISQFRQRMLERPAGDSVRQRWECHRAKAARKEGEPIDFEKEGIQSPVAIVVAYQWKCQQLETNVKGQSKEAEKEQVHAISELSDALRRHENLLRDEAKWRNRAAKNFEASLRMNEQLEAMIIEIQETTAIASRQINWTGENFAPDIVGENLEQFLKLIYKDANDRNQNLPALVSSTIEMARQYPFFLRQAIEESGGQIEWMASAPKTFADAEQLLKGVDRAMVRNILDADTERMERVLNALKDRLIEKPNWDKHISMLADLPFLPQDVKKDVELLNAALAPAKEKFSNGERCWELIREITALMHDYYLGVEKQLDLLERMASRRQEQPECQKRIENANSSVENSGRKVGIIARRLENVRKIRARAREALDRFEGPIRDCRARLQEKEETRLRALAGHNIDAPDEKAGRREARREEERRARKREEDARQDRQQRQEKAILEFVEAIEGHRQFESFFLGYSAAGDKTRKVIEDLAKIYAEDGRIGLKAVKKIGYPRSKLMENFGGGGHLDVISIPFSTKTAECRLVVDVQNAREPAILFIGPHDEYDKYNSTYTNSRKLDDERERARKDGRASLFSMLKKKDEDGGDTGRNGMREVNGGSKGNGQD